MTRYLGPGRLSSFATGDGPEKETPTEIGRSWPIREPPDVVICLEENTTTLANG